MTMPPYAYAAPLPPYAVHAPVAYAPAGPPARPAVAMPRIAYQDGHNVQNAPLVAARTAAAPEVSWGLVIGGALLVLAAVLVWIAFAVQVRTLLGLEAHWMGNTALVPEARELGLHAAKVAALTRIVGFGPLGLLSTAVGLVAVLRGMNPARA